MTRKPRNSKPRKRKERTYENAHLKTYMNEILDYETKRKLEALRDELAKEEETNGK